MATLLGRSTHKVLSKLLITCTGKSTLPSCQRVLACCYSVNKSNMELREKFRHLGGGSVDLHKDETNGIATLWINNPDIKNAFSGKMMVDFDDCILDLENWYNGRAVVLAGVGGTFCSGGDLETVQRNLENGEEMSQLMQQATLRLFDLPLISVAAINGHALGGGAELATACDFRIMNDKAKIGFVQVRMNIAPGWGGCTRLVRLLGRTKALQLLASGMVMNAESAHKTGLIDEVISHHGDMAEHAKLWLLDNYVKGDASATHVIKNMVLAGMEFDTSSALDVERELFCRVWGSKAHKEALESNLKHK